MPQLDSKFCDRTVTQACVVLFLAAASGFVEAVDIKLPRVGGLEVTVHEESGGTQIPIAKAEVCVFATGASFIRGRNSEGAVEYTDAEGFARFDGRPEGPYRVIAVKAGYIGKEQRLYNYNPKKPVRFVLERGSRGAACPGRGRSVSTPRPPGDGVPVVVEPVTPITPGTPQTGTLRK